MVRTTGRLTPSWHHRVAHQTHPPSQRPAAATAATAAGPPHPRLIAEALRQQSGVSLALRRRGLVRLGSPDVEEEHPPHHRRLWLEGVALCGDLSCHAVVLEGQDLHSKTQGLAEKTKAARTKEWRALGTEAQQRYNPVAQEPAEAVICHTLCGPGVTPSRRRSVLQMPPLCQATRCTFVADAEESDAAEREAKAAGVRGGAAAVPKRVADADLRGVQRLRRQTRIRRRRLAAVAGGSTAGRRLAVPRWLRCLEDYAQRRAKIVAALKSRLKRRVHHGGVARRS